MIKYTIVCDQGHTFEGWFPSIAEYERQEKAGEVECLVCGSTKCTRAPMAPSLGAGVSKPDHNPLKCPHCVARNRAIRQAAKSYKEVGNMAEHLAKHPGDENLIGYGTNEDVAKLQAEGQPVFPLPTIPEDFN